MRSFTKNEFSIMFWLRLIVTFQILMYENSHIVVYGYIEAWTYHPMLNISVMPQRRFTVERISVFFLKLRQSVKELIFQV